MDSKKQFTLYEGIKKYKQNYFRIFFLQLLLVLLRETFSIKKV